MLRKQRVTKDYSCGNIPQHRRDKIEEWRKILSVKH